jgi:hypothetical protein
MKTTVKILLLALRVNSWRLNKINIINDRREAEYDERNRNFWPWSVRPNLNTPNVRLEIDRLLSSFLFDKN